MQMRIHSPFYVSSLLLALLAALLSGCAAQPPVNPNAPPRFLGDNQAILLMPVDLELFELTASGLEDPRADWTETAHVHVAASLHKENARRGLRLLPFETNGLSLKEAQEVKQIERLHRAVGIAMLQHERIPGLRLPTKSSVYDWSMGSSVRPLRRGTDTKYALFLYLRDSYASSGRIAMNIVTAVLFGVAQGGVQVGYATLVDLDTGQIAWFSSLARGTGDLRTQAAADEAIGLLLQNLPGSE
jgi:hypothetical protein